MNKCACGFDPGNILLETCDQCEKPYCKSCAYRVCDDDIWILTFCKACGIEHKKFNAK